MANLKHDEVSSGRLRWNRKPQDLETKTFFFFLTSQTIWHSRYHRCRRGFVAYDINNTSVQMSDECSVENRITVFRSLRNNLVERVYVTAEIRSIHALYTMHYNARRAGRVYL